MADKGFYAKLGLKDEQFRKQLQNSRKHINGFSKSIAAIGPMIAGAFSISAITSFVKGSAEAWGKQLKAEAKVEQAVKQTGGAAGFTADELKKMASELQKITTYGDEDILNKVTAQLLSFPKITGAVFKDAQKAILDVATLLDGDIQASAIAIGKALQDPVKGITAMRRMGIMFTETQQDHIANLVKQGKLYEAQELILKEINLQYGGQAEAAAKTGLGALQQLKNAWGDFKEQWFGANFGTKTGMFSGFIENMEYMTWRMAEFKKNGGGFIEWWKRFLRTGSYSEEAFNIAKAAENNDPKVTAANASALGIGGEKMGGYGDMVAKSLEENLKLNEAVEKTGEELEKEAKAAEEAAKELENLRKETRDLDQESMSKITGEIKPVTTEETTGGNIFSEQQLKVLDAFQQLASTRITGFQLAKESLDELGMSMRDLPMTSFTDAYESFWVDVDAISQALNQTMQGMAMAVVDAFGQMIEAMAAGEKFDFGASLLGAIGGFMKQLGEAMISIGLLGELFDKAIKSMQWYVALAAGVALVAAGSLISGIAKKGVGMEDGGIVPSGYPGDTYPALLSSGEMVANPKQIDQMLGGGQDVRVHGVIRGEDLYFLNEKQSSKQRRYK